MSVESNKSKGRDLKTGHDHKSAGFLEKKIKEDGFSPDAAIAAAGKQGGFTNMICTKTLYNYIDGGIFSNLSNKDLPVKKAGKKRKCRKIERPARNNTKGRSISERSRQIDERSEVGHRK
jgi:IS30 family transposase